MMPPAFLKNRSSSSAATSSITPMTNYDKILRLKKERSSKVMESSQRNITLADRSQHSTS